MGIIVDRAGLNVDASGWRWVLNSAGEQVYLNWERFPRCSYEVLTDTVRYFARRIKSKSPDAVYATFETLLYLSHSPSFVAAADGNDELSIDVFNEVRGFLEGRFENSIWRLHHVRHWYRSCADYGSAAFSPEVAFELYEKTIGGNRKGRAVLSLDPEEGPLVDVEITALLNALNDERRRKTFRLDHAAAIWLCIALGCNPKQMALLRECDLQLMEESGVRFFHLKVPRVKKNHDVPRAAFRTRKLTVEIGNVLLSLIAENRAREEGYGRVTGPNSPIFMRRNVRMHSAGAMQEYGRHLYPSEFTKLVSDGVRRLGVVSVRTGLPLAVTTRRLRYTFATRLVREGASMEEIGEALDHTDLQNVRVYFDIKSDIVDSLDRAMALKLGPVAQAFLGKLVASERKAERGDDPSSRVMAVDKASGRPAGLGTCGEHSFCDLLAPIACYTCSQFQPWIDGPHDKILDDLLAQRERKKAAGMDGRMVAIHDATILAIGDVIQRITEVRAA
ncbi:site-specific integrase [Chenggangzhangella methanolivorans]|uniref:Tyrosine-type recombinase/integrase n=2 Tax=Hyphomicrobiales TaxID=356 RepID=A0A9E6RAA5_9HYPH|nr:site-specific integrase [Chenggangzhangella methanolivorans]PZQ18079.1 MAG: hypothetical protein DI565_05055 [Ancylobacter novellus]QZO00150.1 tyrosine-type recombinase/integrase [Chenggangzhangella methanolivorans]HML44354.1 site-specific integrase [Hyphomicrobium zavarzinii]